MMLPSSRPSPGEGTGRLGDRGQQHAAVDQDAGAGDVAGVVRGEVDGRPGDVGRLAGAEQDLGLGADVEGVVPLAALAGEQPIVDEARRDGVDPDLVRRKLAGLAHHQPPEGRLHRAVDRVPAPGALLVHRGDGDDVAAAPLLDHLLRGQLGVDVGGLERQEVPLVDLLLGGVHVRPRGVRVAAAGVGVVDQDVDPAEPLDGGGEDALHVGGVAGVALEDLDLAAGLGDQLRNLLGVAGAQVVGQVVDDDLRALAGVRQRDPAPDAVRGAGDDRHAILVILPMLLLRV